MNVIGFLIIVVPILIVIVGVLGALLELSKMACRALAKQFRKPHTTITAATALNEPKPGDPVLFVGPENPAAVAFEKAIRSYYSDSSEQGRHKDTG
jgi:hypothetical protein